MVQNSDTVIYVNGLQMMGARFLAIRMGVGLAREKARMMHVVIDLGTSV